MIAHLVAFRGHFAALALVDSASAAAVDVLSFAVGLLRVELELARSGFAAGSFELVDPADCLPLVLEHLPAVALRIVGPSLSAADARGVS